MKDVKNVEIIGTFDVQRFFDTLALILSERENLKIMVKVTQPGKEEAAAKGQQPEKRQ